MILEGFLDLNIRPESDLFQKRIRIRPQRLYQAVSVSLELRTQFPYNCAELFETERKSKSVKDSINL